jgi:hypothetical protein
MENAIFSHQHQAVGSISVGVGRRPVMLVSDRDRNDPMDVYAARQEQYAAGVDAMDRSLLSARTPQPAYTEAAVAVVHQLAEQLTTKDAPPSNQAWNINPASTDLHERYSTSSATHSKHTAASGSFPVSAASATTMHSSRQSSPTELLAGASSFDTDVSSLGPSQFFQDLMLVQHDPDGAAARWNMALRRAEGGTLGHASLQALCASTLQQVGVDLGDTVPLQIETELLLMQGQLSTPASTASNKQSSPKRKLRFWKRPTAVKGAFDVAMQQQVLEPVVRQRLCQFGSDYARHLSNTALAPEHCQPRGSNRRSNGRHRRSSAATSAHKRSLQDADHQVLSGAILDICVTFGNDAAPVGYYCLDQTATGQTVNWTATASNGGGKKNKAVRLHVKKEAVWDKAAQRPCVTALAVIFPDRQEFVPPGFCIVRRYPATAVSGSKPTCGSSSSNNAPANLNQGTGERVYLCFRRSREGNPLTGIVPLRPDFAEQVPVGYTVLEKTPRNHSADLLRGTGPPVFLAYRQRLANLETLRPLPLVLSVQSQQHHNASVFEDDDGSDFQQPQVQHRLLQAYYATGGTVVAADVGRFHIMDRSTHSLLSPSSVSNRLKLIEKSRRKAAGESEPDQNNRTAATQTNTSLRELQKMEYNDESSVGDFESVGSSSRRNSLANDYASKGSFATTEQGSIDSVGDSIDVPSIILSALLGSREIDGGIQAIFGSEDPELLQCLEAMRFIPGVDTATHGLPKIQATQRLQARAALLTPILTACYTRHGGAALVAVDGLTTLLKQNFFDDDVDVTDESDNDSSTRLTLLDLAIQSVCDVATSGAQETTFGSCVEFVEHAVRFSQGQLNIRTIGFVVRFYLFVFCFGVSIPTSSSRWPSPLWQPPAFKESGEANQPDDDVPMLLDPRTEGSRSYLPGGAPQAAALAFKELLSLSIVRLGKVSVTDVVVLAQGSSGLPTSVSCGKDIQEPGDVADSLLSSLVDNAVNHVEIANYTQLALHQVQRSGGSELFWHDMIHSCGSALFGNDNKLGEAGRDIYTVIFAVMANLVKASSGKVGTNANRSELLPRDVASKLLSLELLLHFLENWSDEQEAVNGIESVQSSGSGRSIHTLAFSIRRMVVPCLLSNTRAALEDPQVFKRVVRIISELWCSPVYRKHCKAELGILFEHFALRLLQMGPQLIAARKVDLWSDQATISLLSQQVDLLKEVKNWFSYDPKDVIELYLNYDTDISQQIGSPIHLLPGTQLKFFQRLCSGLSNIAEQCGELIGDQIRENQSKIMSRSEEVGGDLSELLSSLEETKGEAIDKTTMRESARLLRKTSLEAISQIVKALAISAASATGSEFTSLLLSWTPADSVIAFQSTYASSPTTERREGRASSRLGCTNGEGDDEILEFWRSAIAKENKERLSDASPSSEEALKTAFDIAERKSLKKAVEYLIACNSLTPAPRDIANFLRLQKEHLDPAGLGNYLGECGMGGAETEYWNSVRHYYVRAISFSGMKVEEGYVSSGLKDLRHVWLQWCTDAFIFFFRLQASPFLDQLRLPSPRRSTKDRSNHEHICPMLL